MLWTCLGSRRSLRRAATVEAVTLHSAKGGGARLVVHVELAQLGEVVVPHCQVVTKPGPVGLGRVH